MIKLSRKLFEDYDTITMTRLRKALAVLAEKYPPTWAVRLAAECEAKRVRELSRR